MNGLSLVLSKSFCPMYDFGTSNKINFGRSTKIDLYPHRLSDLRLQRISPHVATKRILKRCVYSLCARKDEMCSRYKYEACSRSEVPEDSAAVISYVLLGVGIVCMALGVLKSNASYYIFLGAASVYVARGFLGNVMCAYAVLHGKPFSIGDIIKVGHIKGQVTEMGLENTSLLTAEDHRIVVPTSSFYGQDLVNISRAPWHAMNDKIYVQVDDIEKIPVISEEIMNMMRSNSNIHLEDEQPYCYLSGVETSCVELSLGCNLKQMCEDELFLAKCDVHKQAVRIIKKHGAKLGDHMQEIKSFS